MFFTDDMVLIRFLDFQIKGSKVNLIRNFMDKI